MKDLSVLPSLINSFVLAGGLGYLTSYILRQLGVIHIAKNNKDERNISLLLFSIVNMIIYNYIYQLIYDIFGIDNIWICLFITAIIIIVLSFTLFKWILKYFFVLLNKQRKGENLGENDVRPIKSLLFDRNKTIGAYLYDLENNLISYGMLSWVSDENSEDFEFAITPVEKEYLEELDYDSAYKLASVNDDSKIYINIDKKIKMVIMSF